MEHSFNVELASIYGIEEAILIQNLFFWINKNVANNKNFNEERYWTYNSTKAFSELFPYLNESKISRILKKLQDNDIIIKGNFNKEKFDRTAWYAFTDNGISILDNLGYHFSKTSNGFFINEEPIPDNKQQIINTDNKEDTKVSKKDELFEECWKAYRRKGSKGSAKVQWNKLKEEELSKVLSHIKQYVLSVSDIKFQKDFERYLRDKIFMSVIYKNNAVIYDPERQIDNVYSPVEDVMLTWNEYSKMYIAFTDPTTTMFTDGYTNENRPMGAKVKYNGYDYLWHTELKQWIKLG